MQVYPFVWFVNNCAKYTKTLSILCNVLCVLIYFRRNNTYLRVNLVTEISTAGNLAVLTTFLFYFPWKK